ncbi:MAG: hypothetical protein H7Y30_10350, partial [Pyrinomonadaceae bacterium]|nr:hypothetical protein [Pyrinomonadaceae bacterium]
MSDYNRSAKIYWSVMVAAGLLTGAWGFYHCLGFAPAQWGQFIALLSLVLITSSYPIRIPNTTASVTAGDTFTFLSVIMLGIPAGILLGVVDSFVSSHRTTKRATSWIGAPAMMAVSVFLSGNSFYLTLASYANIKTAPLGIASVSLTELLIPLAVMTILQ